MNQSTKDAPQQCFILMCHILKEYEGMYYREIASEMGVDAALFCRWLNESTKLSVYYHQKIESYFANEAFSKYKNILVSNVIESFDIQRDGRIACLLYHMSYTALLHYLFHNLRISDIENEKQYHDLFPDIVCEAMERKNGFILPQYVNYDVVDNVFNQCPDEICAALEKSQIKQENTMVLEVKTRYDKIRRMLVHFYSPKESYDSYMIKCKQLMSLKQIGKIGHMIFIQMPDTMITGKSAYEFEKLSDYAAQKILKAVKKIGEV